MTLNLVPFSDEELKEVQVAVVDRMLEINRDIENGLPADEEVQEEMHTLSKVSSRVSRYTASKS